MHAEDSMSVRISNLRKSLSLNQSELGAKLGCSAMAVSRWERGALKCPANILIRLGTLSKPDDCWFFWRLAGLSTPDVIRVLPIARKRFVAEVPFLKLVARTNIKDLGHSGLVGIPLFPLRSTADQEKGLWDCDFDSTCPERFLAAPREWCPNPVATLCLRIQGSAMEPLLNAGYIVAVDRKQNDVSGLDKKIVIAHHEKLGLIVSRFCSIGKQHMLVPDNREHEATALSSGWRIIGTVLWWIGQPLRAENLGEPVPS